MHYKSKRRYLKYLLIVLLGVFYANSASAQAHDFSPKSNCKLLKKLGYEKYPCPACTKEDKLEQQARAAENKRRSEAATAEYTAKRQASEQARLARIAQTRQQKALADNDRAARIAAGTQRGSAPTRGLVNINAKNTKAPGAAPIPKNEVVYTNAEPFMDHNEHVYGLKVDGKVVFQKDFTEQYSGFGKLEKTNYFILHLSNDGDVLTRYYILNGKGGVVKINGNAVFSGCTADEGQLKLEVSNEKPELIRKWANMNLSGPFFNDRETAVAEIMRPQTGYRINCANYYVASVKVITADMNLKVTNQISAFKIIQIYARCD
jgi:hypothetical protein